VEGSEYRSQPLNKVNHRYRSESIGGYSHASYNSFDQSVASRHTRLAAAAGVRNHPRFVTDIHLENIDIGPSALDSTGKAIDVLDETEDREYEEQSSSQSDSTSTTGQGRIV
jgi:hypothetical protein